MFRGILLLTVFCLILGCNSDQQTEEDFKPDTYFSLTGLKKVKLSESGKKKAKAVWDSIKPMLKVDSTVHGLEYAGEIHISKSNNKVIWLSFDYDSTAKIVEPLRFNMIADYHQTPTTYMYFGNSMVICSDELADGEWKDTVDISLDRGLRELMKGQGIRYDTDRGPTDKLNKEQINSLSQVYSAYQAIAILNNHLNK